VKQIQALQSKKLSGTKEGEGVGVSAEGVDRLLGWLEASIGGREGGKRGEGSQRGLSFSTGGKSGG